MAEVTVNNVVKTYDKREVMAVNQVSFSVDRGELFGLIGPDGAGKTSLFRMRNTLLLPGSGTATVMGFDVVKDYKIIRKGVGYMPGKFSLYQDLKVWENIKLFAGIYGMKRNEIALKTDILLNELGFEKEKNTNEIYTDS